MMKDSTPVAETEPTTPVATEAPVEDPGEGPMVFDLTEVPEITASVTPEATPTTPLNELTVTPSVGSVDMPDTVWVMIQALAKEFLHEDAETKRYGLDERLMLQVLGVIYTDDTMRARAMEVIRKAAADWAETQPLDRAHAEPLP